MTENSGATLGSESSNDSGDKGLRTKSLDLASSIVIGMSSTAPGYSIAASLGWIVAYVAYQSPALVLLGFIPILCIAYAYRELNRETPDCGTTFTWATRVFNPWVGWMGGWGYVTASIIAMASASQIAGQYFYLMFGADGLASSAVWVTAGGVAWIIIFTWVSWKGVAVSARLQYWFLAIEIIVLVIFSVIALVKVYGGTAAPTAVNPDLSWFNPFQVRTDSGSLDFSAISGGLLLAVFLFWGWDSSLSLNEETSEPDKTPGRAAVISTVLLLAVYALTATACLAYAGADPLNESDDVLAEIGALVLGTHFDKMLIFAVLTSAAATTQTTIMPTARTLLSMSAFQAIPKKFARIHPKNLTPSYATIFTGIASIVFFVGLASISSNVLGDATEAVSLLVAFYYGLTGFAGAWHYRNRAGSTLHQKFTRIVMPAFGGIVLLYIFLQTAYDNFNPDNSSTVIGIFGLQMGGIFVISIGTLLLGVVLMFITARTHKEFFSGRALNRHTPIVIGDEIFGTPAALTLPDSTSREHLVIPPEDL